MEYLKRCVRAGFWYWTPLWLIVLMFAFLQMGCKTSLVQEATYLNGSAYDVYTDMSKFEGASVLYYSCCEDAETVYLGHFRHLVAVYDWDTDKTYLFENVLMINVSHVVNHNEDISDILQHEYAHYLQALRYDSYLEYQQTYYGLKALLGYRRHPLEIEARQYALDERGEVAIIGDKREAKRLKIVVIK